MSYRGVIAKNILCRLLAVVIAALALAARAQPQAGYAEVFYPSGDLRIQAYLYRPEGEGAFPVVIYNHGTRDGRERIPTPFPHIGKMLTAAGYAVLVPERRGYGKSDGMLWWQEASGNSTRVVARLQAETDDVLAAIDYLREIPFADTSRMAVMGWSFGGIVTMFAISRSPVFRAAINQAGAALSWDGNSELRSALTAAAGKTATPTLLMVAENDRTTASITTLARVFKDRGVAHRMIIYEPFTPTQGKALAPGHALFSAQGIGLWEHDVVQFLGQHLGAQR